MSGFQYSQPANIWARRMMFWPTVLLLCSVTLYERVRTLDDINQQQAEIAQRLANFLALSAAQGMVQQDYRIFQLQVLQVVQTPVIDRVRFVRLREGAPEQSLPDHSQLLMAYMPNSHPTLRQYSPVNTLSYSDRIHDHLLGYIEVTVDLQPRLQQWWGTLIQQLLLIAVLSILFYFLVQYWSVEVTRPLRRITHWLATIRQGDAVPLAASTKLSQVREFNQIELHLQELSNHVQYIEHDHKMIKQQLADMRQREYLAIASRDDFQSMITHELKTPLNAIWGGVQLLRSEQLSPSQADCLKIIAQGSRTLNQLLDQVLMLLSLDQGRVSMQLKAFNPADMIRQLVVDLQDAAQAKGLALEVDIAHPEIMLSADSSKIHQVLHALLDNAIKFTQSGAVRLRSELEPVDEYWRWSCEVQDSGIGIDPLYHQEVFQPFFQVDSVQSRRNEGAGVGLALVQRLVKVMSGQVLLSSQLGHGACFKLEFQLAEWQLFQFDEGLVGRDVLLYETGKAGELYDMLTAFGLCVHRVVTVSEVLALREQLVVHAVLICPHISSLLAQSLVDELRSDLLAPRLTVIQLVENLQDVDIDAGYAEGVDHWLAWPNRSEEVFKQLSRWLI